MSARLIRSDRNAEFGDLLGVENGPIMRGETVTALNQLELCVKEAKDLVHETQTKMDQLVKTIEEPEGMPRSARKKSKR